MNYSFILFLLLSFNSFGQQITGTITDIKKLPLPYADVMVKDSLDNILAFTITNDKGEYEIELVTQNQKLWVQANFMGYDKQVKEILADSVVVLNFQLKERSEEIKTVKVTAQQPVQIEKNDTTVFNLDRLTNGTEEVVEDILKKLPGVEVEANGKLKYKGREVTKMLLDGDDLFQGNYALGSKNIQAKHIQGVEAINNYSDNPLLKGIENSDEVAINLKFKKGLSLSNIIQLGYGHKNKYSVDYKNIAITKPLKTFTYLNANNLGLQQSAYNYNPAMLLQNSSNSEFESQGFLETGSKASLLKSRSSNFNTAKSGSLNIKPHFSETFSMRLNLDVIRDNAENTYLKQMLVQSENRFNIDEQTENNYRPKYLKGDLNVTKYFTGNFGIENISKFSFTENRHSFNGTVNNVFQQFNSQSRNNFLYNESNFTKRIDADNGLKFTALFGLNSTPEELSLNPGLNFNSNDYSAINNQTVENENQNFMFNAGFYRRTAKKDRLNIDLKINRTNQTLFSQVSDQSNFFTNDIQFNKTDFGLSSSLNIRRNKIELQPHLSYDFIKYKHSKKDGSQSLVDGSVRFIYRPSNLHNFNLNISIQQLGLDENRIFTNYILTSHRTFEKNELSYDIIQNQSFNIRYEFLNPIKYSQLFLVLGAQAGDKSYQTKYEITPNASYLTYFLGNNKGQSAYLSALYQKPFRWLYGKIRINARYNYSDYASELNGTKRNNKIHSQNSGLTWESLVIWNFVLINEINFQRTDFGNYGNESFSNRFELIFQKNNFRIASQFQYVVPSLEQDLEEFLLKAKIQYKLGQFLLSCEGSNLLNEKGAILFSQTDYMSLVQYSHIQPRYFLFGLSFRF